MVHIKQRLMEETQRGITAGETEIKRSNEEIEILGAKLLVEQKALGMQDIPDGLKEDFECSVQVLKDMIIMEENRNAELEKELEVLKYRKAVIASQISDFELNR